MRDEVAKLVARITAAHPHRIYDTITYSAFPWYSSRTGGKLTLRVQADVTGHTQCARCGRHRWLKDLRHPWVPEEGEVEGGGWICKKGDCLVAFPRRLDDEYYPTTYLLETNQVAEMLPVVAHGLDAADVAKVYRHVLGLEGLVVTDEARATLALSAARLVRLCLLVRRTRWLWKFNSMRRNCAARKLQAGWRRVVSDPAMAVCRRRLAREFAELAV